MTDEQAKRVADVKRLEHHNLYDRRVLTELVIELDAERERLATVLAKLPTTADGVPVVPGMTVYMSYGTASWGLSVDSYMIAKGYRVSKDDADVRSCYSTREAALAAAGEPAPTIEAAPSPPPEPERVLANYVGTYRIGPNAPETWADDHLIGVEPDGSTWMLQDGSEKRERFWSWKAVAGFASRGEFRKL